MKFLTLLRHAKSHHSAAGGSDFDRPLNDRGRTDASLMGRALVASFPPPDFVLASPALRVRQTLEYLRAGGAVLPDDRVEFHEALYLAEAELLWDFASSSLMEHDHVWLVAHNPGITEAVEHLSGARLENVPTLGVARIAFEDLVPESPNGTLVYFDVPSHRRPVK
jgi:phosphohistidine phosphatase